MKNQIKKILKNTLGKISDKPFMKFPSEKRSFSQCGEDLIVKFIFDQLGITKPSYIDIGAHDPYYISNTALFYLNGSRGINVEPDPVLFEKFLTERKEDINLNVGVGEEAGEADFYIISSPTLNTFSKEQAEGYAKRGDYQIEEIKKFEVITIDIIINKYCKGIFPDYLSLDAEGIDEILIESLSLLQIRPKVICVETLSFETNGTGIKNNKIIQLLEASGYIYYADTNINSIFVLKEIWEL